MLSLSLFKKIFLIGIICLLIPLWTITLINIGTFKENYIHSLEVSARAIVMPVENDIRVALDWGSQFTEVAREHNESIAIFLSHPQFKDIIDHFSIINLSGEILTHSNIDSIGKRIMPQTLKLIKNSTNPLTKKYKNNYHIFIPVIHDSELQGFMVVGFPASLVDDKIRHLVQDSILVTIVALLIATLIYLISINHFVTKPIKYIIKKIQYITTSGNLTTEIHVHSRDEIQELANQFNSMAKVLYHTFQSIEDKVKERTVKLEELNHELLEQRKKAEAANEAKSQFVANITHELRTPMNGILGMAESLMSTTLTAEQYKQLKIIYESGSILLHLINELLDVAKIESGHMELESIHFDLQKILSETQQLLQARANNKNLALQVEFDKRIPQVLMGDGNRLRQVFLNLLGNSIKFTEKGYIHLKAQLEKLFEDHAIIIFSIEDTGIGIPEEKLNNLFTKFTQVDASTSRKYGGTGLGLYISQQLVELMGSQIQVNSKYGQGTCFWFTLKLAIGTEVINDNQSLPLQEEKLPHFQSTHILLVEDNLTNQKVATILLEQLGCQVDIANNGQEAIEKTVVQTYDLILMDMQMPVLDGLQATQQIRYQQQLAKIPRTIIIAMTANASQQDFDNCIAAGMDDFLTKPISRLQMAKILGKWLDLQGTALQQEKLET